MRLCEIENKYFSVHVNSLIILEAYKNPDQELSIDFKNYHPFNNGNGGVYYASVFENQTGQHLIDLVFTLDKNSNNIDMGNIIPIAGTGKTVYTSLGVQNNGIDMGSSAMRWVFQQIKGFALSQGFDVKKIVSGTRYTGARAKNNPGQDDGGLPLNFVVDQTIKETLIYDFVTNTVVIKKYTSKENKT